MKTVSMQSRLVGNWSSHRLTNTQTMPWFADLRRGETDFHRPDPEIHVDESGEVYITLRVDNENGHAEEEVKVEVRDLLPPAINLYVPAKGLKVQKGVENT